MSTLIQNSYKASQIPRQNFESSKNVQQRFEKSSIIYGSLRSLAFRQQHHHPVKAWRSRFHIAPIFCEQTQHRKLVILNFTSGKVQNEKKNKSINIDTCHTM